LGAEQAEDLTELHREVEMVDGEGGL